MAAYPAERAEKQELLFEVREQIEKLLQAQNLSEEEKLAILNSALSIVDSMES